MTVIKMTTVTLLVISSALVQFISTHSLHRAVKIFSLSHRVRPANTTATKTAGIMLNIMAQRATHGRHSSRHHHSNVFYDFLNNAESAAWKYAALSVYIRKKAEVLSSA